MYNSSRQYLIVVDRIWIFKQLCENFKDPQHVGGLGLKLTGADTVIFVEHDWNPMKDLQVRNHQPFEPVPSPLYIPIFTNFAQALFLVDTIKKKIAFQIVPLTQENFF